MRTTTIYAGLLFVTAAVTLPVLLTRDARSADHRDGPGPTADPASDINDLYTFLDGERLVMAMTLFPFATAEATFSDATQYIFHTSSGAEFGKTTVDVDVICTFAGGAAISCWVGDQDYVTGDPRDAAAPLVSASGKLSVFAGLRGDPFFFNLTGFVDTVTVVKGAAASLTFDGSGCPGTLSEVATADNPSRTNPDDFATANVLALVVAVDRSLVTQGGNIVSVWASTNKRSE
jgi:hypothetical protein